MRPPNRDMLVLVKDDFMDADLIKVELERIHKLLQEFETLDTVSKAHEVYDLNRFKKIRDTNGVERFMRERKLKPFIFISNNN